MTLSLIVAVGKSWQIGKDNRLMWHIPEDLKLFKAITTGHHLIMGRRTFESIGKALPDRTTIVLSRSGFKAEGVYTLKSLDEAIEFCEKRGEEEAFVVGGGEIYKEALPRAGRLYLTSVDFNEKGDTFFPPVNLREWVMIDEKKFDKSLGKEGVIIPAWQHFVLQRKPR